jgi:hypothetical protein
LLILLELLLKGIGFVIRVLNNNRSSSRFRLYIKKRGITSILFVYLPQVFRRVRDIIFRVKLVGFIPV